MNQTLSSSQTDPLSAGHGTVVLFGEVLADVFPDRSVLGGAPFNVACHLKAFGLNPLLITRLGHDTLRDEVMKMMAERGLDTHGVQFDSRHPTGQVNVHMKAGGHRFEILDQQAYDFIQSDEALACLASAHPTLFYFGTLAQRNAVSRQALMRLLQSAGAAKFLDINLRTPWYEPDILRQSLLIADIVKLNDAELGELAATFSLSGSNPHDQARALMERFDLKQLLVTCGEAGAWHMSPGGEPVHATHSTTLPNLVDTVGAGDGFASIFMLGNSLGWPIAHSLQRANAFAAAICGIRGAVPERPDFYQPYKEAWGI